jgi:hypothetical protein
VNFYYSKETRSGGLDFELSSEAPWTSLPNARICWSNGEVVHFKITNLKHQITNKSQIPIPNDRNRFGILNFGHCDLPFDLTQGGELVEPFEICDLLFGIFGELNDQ